MTRRRWIADEVKADRAAITGGNARHLARVLRAQVGQQFDIADGERVRRGVIVSVSEDRVEFELHEDVPVAEVRPCTLLLAVFKFDRFEWAVEKCTELGVARIVPVIARRTDEHLAQSAEKRVKRWQKIAQEAAQQSRRVSPPAISLPLRLKAALTEYPKGIVLFEKEKNVSLRQLVEGENAVTLAVGPEGGWADEEIAMFSSAGWQSASLGPTILRAETVAITASGLVLL